MQEDVERRTVAISLKAAKLTGRTLALALTATGRKIQKGYRAAQTPHGRQSVKKLMNHGVSTNSLPLTGDTKLFDRVAREFKVDYAFYKTGPQQYKLFFKAGQADAITECFVKYSKLVMDREKDKRPPIREQAAQAAEQAARSRPRQRERAKEAVRDDR